MTYHVKDRPNIPRHQVEAERQPDGTWQLTDYAGAVSYASDEDFQRFYEPVAP